METFENIRRMIDFPYCHSCEGSPQDALRRNPLFSIEIRTISRIIPLKRAEFLALTDWKILGIVNR